MDSKLMQYIPQDDIYLFNTGNAQKAWLCFGCHYIPELGLHRFILWAPNAQAVSIISASAAFINSPSRRRTAISY